MVNVLCVSFVSVSMMHLNYDVYDCWTCSMCFLVFQCTSIVGFIRNNRCVKKVYRKTNKIFLDIYDKNPIGKTQLGKPLMAMANSIIVQISIFILFF